MKSQRRHVVRSDVTCHQETQFEQSPTKRSPESRHFVHTFDITNSTETENKKNTKTEAITCFYSQHFVCSFPDWVDVSVCGFDHDDNDDDDDDDDDNNPFPLCRCRLLQLLPLTNQHESFGGEKHPVTSRATSRRVYTCWTLPPLQIDENQKSTWTWTKPWLDCDSSTALCHFT